MTTKYFALLTNQGAAKLANAAALGTKVNITQLAVGDGGGTLPTPDPAQTKLIGEKRRASLNSLTIDAANGSQIIAEQIIPEGEGGFWIREIGMFDADGVMIAVANCAETYKPQLAEGSGRTQTVRMIIIVNSTSAVTLKIDPSVVLATRKYVDDGVIVAKQCAEKLQTEAKEYADTLLEQAKEYSGDTLKQHVDDANPHAQYLKIASALKELADAGKVPDALAVLGLTEPALAGASGGVLGESGYIKIPMIIAGIKKVLYLQWGTFTSVTGGSGTNGVYESPTATVTWPVAFPNNVLQVITGGSSDVGGAGQQEMAWAFGKSRTSGSFGFQCRSPNTTMTGSYIALGY
ncbi:phage tail protein [Pantoea sp. DY-5]|uniref:phage tail protein n=1 Tax=Pantoea sp. DY-5 TaxID=2871488 RepID=UPI001C98B3AB|nr:phage tail protein [Pantoea sp. DY-5]MBY4840974.1 phage tail protein [Pantoea sp. DY-5]